MGTLRKYLLNGAIISAVFGGISAFRQQRKQGADWRTVLTWIAWALSLVVAIGTVRIDSKADDDDPRAAAHRGRARGPKPAKDIRK